jgi:hypothetical protein
LPVKPNPLPAPQDVRHTSVTADKPQQSTEGTKYPHFECHPDQRFLPPRDAPALSLEQEYVETVNEQFGYMTGTQSHGSKIFPSVLVPMVGGVVVHLSTDVKGRQIGNPSKARRTPSTREVLSGHVGGSAVLKGTGDPMTSRAINRHDRRRG